MKNLFGFNETIPSLTVQNSKAGLSKFLINKLLLTDALRYPESLDDSGESPSVVKTGIYRLRLSDCFDPRRNQRYTIPQVWGNPPPQDDTRPSSIRPSIRS